MNPSPHITERMHAEGLPDVMLRTFERQVSALIRGETGLIDASTIEPVDHVQDLDDVRSSGTADLSKLVLIKLNGGLGTSMGLRRAKSLLPAREGWSFLDIIVSQVLALRAACGVRLPLVFMNSFSTETDTLEALARRPELAVGQPGIPLSFVQHKVPKLLEGSLEPASWPADPGMAWCPPGHGDLYPALVSSGVLDRLLAEGFRYAFVSNADNLGAVVDPRILDVLVGGGAPMLMEVADRTAADRKGGHIAHMRCGGYTLRESAQCPEDELEAFQDIDTYRFFNTNSIWLDLQQLHDYLADRDGIIDLPLICNQKTLDPRDPTSPPVVQLETAMGAALSVLPGADVLRVSRERFAPVKTTNDLLVLWSDRYHLNEEAVLETVHTTEAPSCRVDLDPEVYKLFDDFSARFAGGVPSLKGCRSLLVRGDVRFGSGVKVKGDTEVRYTGEGYLEIPPGTVLSGSWPKE